MEGYGELVLPDMPRTDIRTGSTYNRLCRKYERNAVVNQERSCNFALQKLPIIRSTMYSAGTEAIPGFFRLGSWMDGIPEDSRGVRKIA